MDRIVQYLDLPLQDSVLIFSLVLAILLFTPILFTKLRIPTIVGLILAGALLGPNGLGVLDYDKSFELFGQVGVLYIMFLAGIDVDLNDFRKNRGKSIVFGMYTFWIPMILGVLTSVGLIYLIYDNLIGASGEVAWVFGEPVSKATVWKYSFYSAVILASCYASNTLLSYPIVNRYGVSSTRSVSISVAGTMITTVLALLVLAVVVEIVKGELTAQFWIRFAVGLTMFLLVLGFIFPLVGRWFFKRYSDNVAQYIFVLGMVFMGAFLAKLAGIEYIVGAFLAGISLNKLIPKRSPLMNRIDFVGNAIFIPFFLISVGMIVDFTILFKDVPTVIAAVMLSVVATVAKWLAAKAEEVTYKMKKVETTMIFGLTNAQAAATLAAAMIAYHVVLGYTSTGEPVRLLPTEILNGIVIMILVTCTISSIATEKASKIMAADPEFSKPDDNVYRPELRILIPVSNPANIERLMELAVLVKDQKERQPIYSLCVVDEVNDDSKKMAERRRLLDKTVEIGASVDNKVKKIARYDLNVATGISNVVKEKNISDVIMGLHQKSAASDSFFGNMTSSLLDNVNRTIYIYRPVLPLNTIRRIQVAAPALSEKESGFRIWCSRITTLASQVDAKLIFHCNSETAAAIRHFYSSNKISNRPSFIVMDEWDRVEGISEQLLINDLFIVITAREQSISYQKQFEQLPEILCRSFQKNSFIVMYPEQFKEGEIDRLQSSPARII